MKEAHFKKRSHKASFFIGKHFDSFSNSRGLSLTLLTFHSPYSLMFDEYVFDFVLTEIFNFKMMSVPFELDEAIYTVDLLS